MIEQWMWYGWSLWYLVVSFRAVENVSDPFIYATYFSQILSATMPKFSTLYFFFPPNFAFKWTKKKLLAWRETRKRTQPTFKCFYTGANSEHSVPEWCGLWLLKATSKKGQDSGWDRVRNIAKGDISSDKNTVNRTDVWIIHYCWNHKHGMRQAVIHILEVTKITKSVVYFNKNHRKDFWLNNKDVLEHFKWIQARVKAVSFSLRNKRLLFKMILLCDIVI